MSARRPPEEEKSHLERVNEVLNRLHVQRGHGAMLQVGDEIALDGEAVEWRNPLTEICDAEERIVNDLAGNTADTSSRLKAGLADRIPEGELRDRLENFLDGAAQELAADAFSSLIAAFLEWIFSAGPNPLDVVKRLIAFTKLKRPDLLRNASFRDLGDLLNEKHATMHARCDALFEGLPALLKHAFNAPTFWKKTATACRNMAKAQEGNSTRKTAEKMRRAVHGSQPQPKTKKHAHKRNSPRLAD